MITKPMRCIVAVAIAALVSSLPLTAPLADAAAWTVPECMQEIRELVGDATYSVEHIGEFEQPDGSVQALFRGAGDDSRTDRFWVDRQRRFVAWAYLPSRVDDSYYAVGPNTAQMKLLGPPQAEEQAISIVRRHCPSVLQSDYLEEADTSASPYIFTWEKLSPHGVRLGSKVAVKIDPVTGQFCGWWCRQRDVLVSLPPRLAAEDAVGAASEVIGSECGPPTETFAAVIGSGEEQRILWYVFYVIERRRFCVVVEDASGEAAVLH